MEAETETETETEAEAGAGAGTVGGTHVSRFGAGVRRRRGLQRTQCSAASRVPSLRSALRALDPTCALRGRGEDAAAPGARALNRPRTELLPCASTLSIARFASSSCSGPSSDLFALVTVSSRAKSPM